MADSSPEDRTLAARCIAGEGRAWEELARRFEPAMRARVGRLLARKRGRPASDAEVDEAVQEALVRLSRNGARLLSSFQWRCSLEAFASAVAAVAASDLLVADARRAGRTGPRVDFADVEEILPDDAPEPGAGVVDAERSVELERLVERLPPRDRLVVRLFYWDGAGSPEIARLLGTRPEYVRVVLQRALEKLRRKIGKR